MVIALVTSPAILPPAPLTIARVFKRPSRRGLPSFYTSIAIAPYPTYPYGPTWMLVKTLFLRLPAPF